MAAPALSSTVNYGSKTQKFTITQSGANQGSVALNLTKPIAAMQFFVTGTMDSSSIAMTVSADGTNYIAPITTFTALTVTNTGRALTITTDGAWLYYKVTWSAAGASASTTLTIVVKYI